MKLNQTGLAEDYLCQFEEMLARVDPMRLGQQINLFTTGLVQAMNLALTKYQLAQVANPHSWELTKDSSSSKKDPTFITILNRVEMAERRDKRVFVSIDMCSVREMLECATNKRGNYERPSTRVRDI